MSGLAAKILAIHGELDVAGVPHAFGGALALAWCTERARGTIDIDLNIFLDAGRANEVLEAMPDGVRWASDDVRLIERDGQARLWWESTPVDVFMNTTEFHAQAAARARWQSFAGAEVPFLSCADVAVFKAFFNRTKDWADLEEMVTAHTVDLDHVVGVLVHFLGATDERIERIEQLRALS